MKFSRALILYQVCMATLLVMFQIIGTEQSVYMFFHLQFKNVYLQRYFIQEDKGRNDCENDIIETELFPQQKSMQVDKEVIYIH